MKIQHVTKTQFELPTLELITDEHGVVDVPDDVAGRPPDERLEQLMLDHRAAVEAHDHEGARALKEEIVGVDPGSGLLAQAVWKPYGKAKPAAAANVKQEGGES